MMNETSQESMESSNQIKSLQCTDETLKIFTDIKFILDFNDLLVKDSILL